MTRSRAAVLLLAGLTLAACGNVHPGAAAVVDDQTISMKTVDKTAEVFCIDTAREAQTNDATLPNNADIRRQAVVSLVALVVARRLADEEGVTPQRSTYEIPESSRDEVARRYRGVDVDEALRALEVTRELREIAVALGAKSAGEKVTGANEDQVTQAGYAEISAALPKSDVKFAPRFGLNGKIKQVATTGSLSVAAVDLGEDKPNQLPKAQRCT